MEIVIDIDAPSPLFTQLIEQIKHAVLNEVLKPGDALPSIRQLATDLELNNKTVAKAYSVLERDAIIQPKGYRGTFIHPEAKVNCSVDIAALANERFESLISELKIMGVTDSEMRIAFSEAMKHRR